MEGETNSALSRREDKTAELNQQQSPLLCLPAEIRNKIYTYTAADTEIRVAAAMQGSARRYGPSKFTMRFPLPGLLGTCKQIYHEASTLLYTHATFNLMYSDAWYWLYSNCTHAMCAHVTWLRIPLILADYINQVLDEGQPGMQGVKACTLSLPSLERIHVVRNPWNRKDQTSEALRKWFGKESLFGVFETHKTSTYCIPTSLEKEIFY